MGCVSKFPFFLMMFLESCFNYFFFLISFVLSYVCVCARVSQEMCFSFTVDLV